MKCKLCDKPADKNGLCWLHHIISRSRKRTQKEIVKDIEKKQEQPKWERKRK